MHIHCLSQNEMIQDEEKIKTDLLKSGKRVREATRTMQMQLLAAFTGDGHDGEDVPPLPVAKV